MLIRSQDKEMIVNVDATKRIRVGEKCLYDVCADKMRLGYYSTKAKAMKVLDMIQEAYADAELTPMAVPNIGKMFAEASASKENELLAEAIGKALMNKMVFQMPEDSEVEA
nr:MAG TPA: hypothetical protein [Caudoviricetes sp.]